MRLDGQVAIVTGAAQGIGKGIALVLSDAGAKIVIGDIQDSSSTVKEIEGNGGRAVSMIMDTSNSDDARALVDLALKEFGQLDILVNDAAIDAPDGNAWDLSDGDLLVNSHRARDDCNGRRPGKRRLPDDRVPC